MGVSAVHTFFSGYSTGYHRPPQVKVAPISISNGRRWISSLVWRAWVFGAAPACWTDRTLGWTGRTIAPNWTTCRSSQAHNLRLLFLIRWKSPNLEPFFLFSSPLFCLWSRNHSDPILPRQSLLRTRRCPFRPSEPTTRLQRQRQPTDTRRESRLPARPRRRDSPRAATRLRRRAV